ncbi:MAG: Nramp family divalent metal transporter [Gemmatimonadales bacterium]|jgi:Mn2+/Fe2+ NRAMP family transporter|nr:MAG: Nramp family divalent metal transporter [Gemmatimonadales bacterium]
MADPEADTRRPRLRSAVGPGWIVAAAFLGPGTITTATLAGARFGTALLWALLFSTLATMGLQEMAARLGLVTGNGLGEAIRGRFRGAGRVMAALLVVAAIAGGNAAYQTGNLLGGSLGLQGIVGGPVRGWVIVLGALAFALLWTGSYRLVERVMAVMVAVMSLVFLATAATMLPAAGPMLEGLFVPALPDGSLLVAVGLVGTTVVPYNLFLHASAVGERYTGGEADLPAARMELALSIGLGGVVSMAVLLTAASTLGQSGAEVTSAADMARSLEPILGRWAGVFFAVGLFAAGMTSAVTAPLAAAYATAGALGWERDLHDARVRAVWGTVLGVGVVLGVLGVRPVPAILFAQAANGILLPAVAVFLLGAVNDRRLMRGRQNRVASNVVGGVVVLVATVLGLRALLAVVGLI